MIKSVSRYRFLIIVVLIVVVLLFRKIYPSLYTSNSSKQTITEFKRGSDNIVVTNHARCRMKCRDVTKDEIKKILREGDINYSKSDLNNKKGPKYALEGYGDDKQHLRIVVAPVDNKLMVVTCIDLDKEWQCDCN